MIEPLSIGRVSKARLNLPPQPARVAQTLAIRLPNDGIHRQMTVTLKRCFQVENFFKPKPPHKMALKIGEKAPDFTLPCTDGTQVSASQLKGNTYVIYFYPKDFTPGCTKEACSFRDSYERFRGMNIPIYGVSRDSMESHHRFKKEHNLPFELLSDESGKVCKAFKSLVPVLGVPMRITYLVDANQTIIGCYDSMFDAFGHITQILKQAEESKQA